jgi:hypothetical protein
MAISPRPSPSEGFVRFAFKGSDCLYRDHLGRRVVADAEGCGILHVERAECQLLPVRDGVEGTGFPMTYDQSVTLCALGDGVVEGWCRTGSTQHPAGEAQTVLLPYSGSGWIVSTGSSVILDDRSELAEIGPAPFFWRADGEGSAEIVAGTGAYRLIDAFDIDDEAALGQRDWQVQNISKLSRLESCFPDGTQRSAHVASHLNRASWSLRLPEGCSALILRKLYDRFHGRQRARVLVDGAFAGWWYEPRQDRKARWHVSDFGIPPELVSGKDSVRITVDPPSGTPLWSVSRIEAYGWVPADA